MQKAGRCPEWRAWQTGLELQYLGLSMLRVKEAAIENPTTFCDYRRCLMVIRSDSELDWVPLNVSTTSILEILLPNEALCFRFEDEEEESNDDNESTQTSPTNRTYVVNPNSQYVAEMMAKTVEHIDTLLEDWYPDLGARFVQNSKGMYLITRAVPCMHCLLDQIVAQGRSNTGTDAWSVVELAPGDNTPTVTKPILIGQTNGADDGPVYPQSLSASMEHSSKPNNFTSKDTTDGGK